MLGGAQVSQIGRAVSAIACLEFECELGCVGLM